MECTDLWDRYNLYNLYVTYAFGSAHVKSFAVLFDCAQSNRTAKDFTCAEPNAYLTYKLYKLYLSQRSVHSIDLACAKEFILNKMAGKEECVCFSCFETTEYTCLTCERFKKKKKNLFLMCTCTSNRQKLSIKAISKAKRQDFSEQNL